MKRCECVNPYKKLYEEENIEVGDIISLDPIANRAKLSFNRINKKTRRKKENSISSHAPNEVFM